MANPQPGKAALAAWPRFLMTHVVGGLVLGGLFTAVLLGFNARGLGSLVLSSDMPALATVSMGLLCAALASCGMLATAMGQFESYPAPPASLPIPAEAPSDDRRPRRPD